MHHSHKFHIPDWLSCYWLTGGALRQHLPHHHGRLPWERVHHPTGGQGHGDWHLERLERGGPRHPLDGGTQAHHLHHRERHHPRYAWAADRTHTYSPIHRNGSSVCPPWSPLSHKTIIVPYNEETASGALHLKVTLPSAVREVQQQMNSWCIRRLMRNWHPVLDENYKGDAIFNLTPGKVMYIPFSQYELKFTMFTLQHVSGQIVLSSSAHLSERKHNEILLVTWPSASGYKACWELRVVLHNPPKVWIQLWLHSTATFHHPISSWNKITLFFSLTDNSVFLKCIIWWK